MSDHELLEAIYGRLWYGVALGVVILLIELVAIYFKWRVHREGVVLIGEARQLHAENKQVLVLLQDWAEVGRATRKEAVKALESITTGPTREELAKAVEAVPERTKDLVVKEIIGIQKNGDSDPGLKVSAHP